MSDETKDDGPVDEVRRARIEVLRSQHLRLERAETVERGPKAVPHE